MNIFEIENKILLKYTKWKEAEDREPYFAVAVDFDSTLFTDDFPLVGEPITPIIELCRRLMAVNDIKLVLWTCRGGEELETALYYCAIYGLDFVSVNEDSPEIKHYWNSRGFIGSNKVSAKYYIDDLALNPYF